MANTLRFKRGLLAGLPSAAVGEPLFTTDTFDLYIGTASGTQKYQKFIASGTTSQLLRGDGSLLTMPIVLTSPANGEVLKYNGTNWVNSSDAGITGSLTTNYIPKATSATTLGNSLVYDSGTTIGIGTNSPAEFVHIRTSVFGTPLLIENTGSTSAYFGLKNSGGSAYVYSSNNELNFATSASATQRARITSTGNFIINNASTDNGLRFQVTGDGFFSGSVGIGQTTLLGSNFRISKTLTGSASAINFYIDSVIQSDVTNSPKIIATTLSTQAAAFTIPIVSHFYANQGSIGAGSAITTQIGFQADNTLTGATNNFGFYGNIASGTGRWNLYMNGTAANYLNGNTLIGSTSDTGEKLQVSGTMKVTSTLSVGDTSTTNILNVTGATASNAELRFINGTTRQMRFAARGDISQVLLDADTWDLGIRTIGSKFIFFSTNGTERMRLDASGNLGLGVTPSAWAILRAIQVGLTGNLSGYISSTEGAFFSSNSFYNGGAFVYQVTGNATQYEQKSGRHIWSTAASGTAGTNISFTQALTLFATGNLAVNTPTDSGFRLDVNGTMRVSGASTLSGGVTLGHTGGVAVTFPGGQAFRSNGGIFIDYGNGGSGDLVFRRGAGVTNTLTLAVADGAATFSSSVGIGGTPAQRLDVQGSANSIQARFGNVAGRGLTIGTSAISGTNDAGVVFNAPTATDGTLVFQTSSTDRMTLNSSGLNVATAIAIGTTPDTNLPFKILKNINSTVGIRFENTSTGASAYSAVQFGTDVTGGTAFTNMVYGSSGITESGVYKPNGTSIINTGSGGLNFLAVSQPIRFFTSTGNGTERVRIKNEGHVRFVPLAAAPTTNVEAGDVYYDSTTNKLRCYNGTTWNDLF